MLFTSATALLAAFAKAEPEGQLAERLLFHGSRSIIMRRRRPVPTSVPAASA
jgi:hypothetical protein